MEPRDAEPLQSAPASPVSKPDTHFGGVVMPLVAGLLAGIVGWAIGEYTHDYFNPSEEAASQAYNFTQLNKEQRECDSRNGALTFGAWGALLGAALGVVGGLMSQSTRAGLAGAVIGLVLGGLAGALPPFGILPWMHDRRTDDFARHDLLIPLLAHAGLWSGIGLAAGLAYSIGRARVSLSDLARAAFGGLLGATIGTALFEVLGAVFFPMAETPSPFSARPETRLIARVLVGLFAVLGAYYALENRRVVKTTLAASPASGPAEL